jgi:hypothetical protein
MRLSVKVAPGVRVSGRVGGRRHHHHHHHHHHRNQHHHQRGYVTHRPAPIVRRGSWMRSVPPWRLAPGAGVFWLFVAMLFLCMWMLELEIWLLVWLVHGTILGIRRLAR